MALTYTYDDNYVVDSVTPANLEAAELKALTDLGKQLIVDAYYLEQMCKCLVYIDLGGKQLEAEGMGDKVAHYRKEYDRYNRMGLSDNHSDETISSGTMYRN